MHVAPAASEGPARWSPGAVAPPTSTRTPGLIRGGLDAWLGRAERAAGVALTEVQVATLAPFLAREADLDVETVLQDLRRVRVHVGGLAHGAGNTATAIGLDIYVSDAARATRMLSWPGRRWLVHELAHTMQWRRSAGPQASDAVRDRAFLDTYLGSYVAFGGSVRNGGFAQALRELRRRREAGEPIGNVGDLIHDTHPLEREAARIAAAFDAPASLAALPAPGARRGACEISALGTDPAQTSV